MAVGIKFADTLNMFSNIILLYRDNRGELHIGNIEYSKGNASGENWVSTMYEDALPEDDTVVAGWNELDKRKGRVEITPRSSAEAGVEAFMSTYGIEGTWRDPLYYVIKSYPDIDKYTAVNKLEMKELVAFGILAK